MDKAKVKNLTKKLEGLRTLTAAARDQKAEAQFGIEPVSQQLTVAASAGHDRVTISPATPLDLRASPAAIETTTLLQQAGFVVEWQKRQYPPEDPAAWVMMVSWASKP